MSEHAVRPAPVSSCSPCMKRPPEQLTRDELLERLMLAEQRAAELQKFKRAPMTNLEYFSSLLKVVYHGKSVGLKLKAAYKSKGNYEDFVKIPSVSGYILQGFDDETKMEIFETFKSAEKTLEFNDIVRGSIKQKLAFLIRTMHCLGICCNKYGYSKPRSLQRMTFYEYIIDLQKKDAKVNAIQPAIGYINMIAAGHIYTESDVDVIANALWDFLLSLTRYISQECSESDEIDEEAKGEEDVE